MPAAGGPGVPWAVVVGAVVAASLALLIWTGRRTLFSVDDLLWFMSSPALDLEGMLQPHNGHLIAVPRLLYHVAFELFGATYAPIRVLTALAAGATGVLFFVWAARRVGRPVALAGMALLLVLGTSYIFLIAGDGLMVQLSLSAGLAALLALERGDRLGDGLACGLLCFGIVTYSVALAMLVAAAVAVLRGTDRRRIWIVAVPAIAYGAWWLWARGDAGAPADEVELGNLLVLPAYAFESLSSVLGALTGLDHELAAPSVRPEFDTTTASAGPALALAALIAFVWRLRRPRVAEAVWVALGFLLSLWVLGALTADAASPPNASRFVYFFAVGVLMVAAGACVGLRWTRGRLIAIWAIVACGLAANVLSLHEGGEFRRDVDAPQMRAELTGVELAGESAQPRPDLSQIANGAAILNHPFAFAPVDEPSDDYLSAVDRYGALGYEPAELRAQPEELRARTDAMLIGAYGIDLRAHDPAAPRARCRHLDARAGGGMTFELPAGGAVLETRGAAGPVELRRSADQNWVAIGGLAPRNPAAIRIPADAVLDPWYVSAPGSVATICPL